MYIKKRMLLLLVPFMSCTTSVSLAGEVDIPNQFSSGTAALADEVNENFSALEIGIDDNASQISTMQNTIDSLESEVDSLTQLLQSLSIELTLNPSIDTTINLNAPSTNYADSDELRIFDGGPFATSGLLKFDLDNIPNGASIEAAELRLWQTGEAVPDMEICVYQVTSSWDENVVYSTAPERDSECMASEIIEDDVGYFYWHGLNGLVQSWIDDDNFGLALELTDPDLTGTTVFNSTERERYIPELVIRYKAL